MSAADRWRDQLSGWGIPAEILATAPESPWWFPPEMFHSERTDAAEWRSTVLAAEALPDDGSVLDVGCGGGAAALALVPPAATVFGVDRQPDMIETLLVAARRRGVSGEGFVGEWMAIEASVPGADVVVCRNVFYNVAELGPFATALGRHARRRVVAEITERHPTERMRPMWKHFWNHDLPHGPTADDAVELLRDSGLPVRAERFEVVPVVDVPLETLVTFMRRRLCLPSDRDRELLAFVQEMPRVSRRVALWWDT